MGTERQHDSQPKLDFDFFDEGDRAYDAMLAAIAAARRIIRLEAYIFADDEIGRQFADALMERAEQGVDVRVHIDSAGSFFRLSRYLPRQLRARGVKTQWYHPAGLSPVRFNRRNHRKLLVVDDSIAFLGGLNIQRENSLRVFGALRQYDIHFAIRGPLVAQSIRVFDALWKHRREPGHRRVELDSTEIVTNRSMRFRRALRRLYRKAFANADSTIYLTTPYLIPDFRTRRALIFAAQRGVDVRMLVPRLNDSRIARWASQAGYDSLLRRGVRLYEYLPRMLHAKAVVVDHRWSMVGSTNMDYRSFFLNYELNLVTADARMAEVLSKQFLSRIEEAEEIQAGVWERRGVRYRIAEFVCWLGRRWL